MSECKEKKQIPIPIKKENSCFDLFSWEILITMMEYLNPRDVDRLHGKFNVPLSSDIIDQKLDAINKNLVIYPEKSQQIICDMPFLKLGFQKNEKCWKGYTGILDYCGHTEVEKTIPQVSLRHIWTCLHLPLDKILPSLAALSEISPRICSHGECTKKYISELMEKSWLPWFLNFTRQTSGLLFLHDIKPIVEVNHAQDLIEIFEKAKETKMKINLVAHTNSDCFEEIINFLILKRQLKLLTTLLEHVLLNPRKFKKPGFKFSCLLRNSILEKDEKLFQSLFHLVTQLISKRMAFFPYRLIHVACQADCPEIWQFLIDQGFPKLQSHLIVETNRKLILMRKHFQIG